MVRGLKPAGFDWFDQEPVKNTAREKRNHPCQVPEKMVERFILGTTNPGDLVGDCYTGSGTTAICALRNDRNFGGCEIDPAYVEVAQKAVDQEFLRKGDVRPMELRANLVEIRKAI